MRISIITVCYNSQDTIEDTILSVYKQEYPDREHIIIDGLSTDGTLEIIKKHNGKFKYVISEPDEGIYDAMNKGIKLAKGEIICFLHSDDVFFSDSTLSRIANKFKDKKCSALIGNTLIVNNNKIIRYYKAKNFKNFFFKLGMMPPHPSSYFLKSCYESYGLFNTKYKIAADFELLLRFLYINNVKYEYLPEILVKMRDGGVSNNIKNKLQLNREIFIACRENGIKTNYLYIYLKYFIKIFQIKNVFQFFINKKKSLRLS